MANKMKAVILREHGGLEVLQSEEIDLPEPGPGQVRVAIKAVALNHLDLWVRKGNPAFHLEYPHRLGAEMSGTIDKFGPECEKSNFQKGDPCVICPGLSCGLCPACLGGRDNLCPNYRLMGENAQGGYAEYTVIPISNLAPYPTGLSFPEAAASILTFMTSWQMLVSKAAIEPGQQILIHGAGSGVGVAAIQIAKLFRCDIIATAGSDEKLSKAKDLGAHHTINYREQDFVKEVKAITNKKGVDIVFEHIGGETFSKSVKVTRNGGRIVTCGATSGFKPEIDLRHIFFRQIEVLGSTMSSKGDFLTVLRHIARGEMKPIIHKVLPLEEAKEAHRILENREAFGKVVLTP